MAKECGADYVKFQTSIPSDHISKFAKKAKYQKINTKGNNTQLKMANKLILSFSDFIKLRSYCLKKKINFYQLLSAWDQLIFSSDLKWIISKSPQVKLPIFYT